MRCQHTDDPDQGANASALLGGGRWLNSFNQLPAPQAQAQLFAICSSLRWAERVTATRPHRDLESLKAAAERIWLELQPADWREALDGHPRIGGHGGAAPAHSEVEQAAVGTAPDGLRRALAVGNLEYEWRFGHVFLIAAAGRGAEEILAELTRRTGNSPETELREAAAEHCRITSLRLERLATDRSPAASGISAAASEYTGGQDEAGRADSPSGV